jgi:hypothetical protein
MVKTKNTINPDHPVNKGCCESSIRPAKIGPDTKYDTCTTRMTAFGGMLGLIKFLDYVNFKEIFDTHYHSPKRKPRLGCYKMVLGFLMLLFVGFSRIGHFAYLRKDDMICGILNVTILPAISTFWRYLRSLTLNHSEYFLTISAVLRARVWQACELGYTTICIDIDTTVSTVYGKIEGSRKGHNTKHRGKKGLRPVLLFIEQTREYLCGTQRQGTTMSDEEVAKLIARIGKYLPSCVKHVIIRGDAEFIGGKTVAMCRRCGYDFILGNKKCAPNFVDEKWYTYGSCDYNEAMYEPAGWDEPCRFVVMRLLKDKDDEQDRVEQLNMFGNKEFKYRVFATSLCWKPHLVISKYDKRADVENLIGESQREGIIAIPSRRFLSNHTFFQIVMLAYNIWRWMKILSGYRRQFEPGQQHRVPAKRTDIDYEIVDHTIRIARLKMLFVPAKITYSGRYDKVSYSTHDERTAGLLDFMEYLDRRRKEEVDWKDDVPLRKYRIAS